MSRTVTALFGSRDEAEAARWLLGLDAKLEAARVLAKDTAAALGDLSIDPEQVKIFRDALARGDHLLVAQVARGEDSARIIRALSKTRTREPQGDEHKLSYGLGAMAGGDERRDDMRPPASEAPPSGAADSNVPVAEDLPSKTDQIATASKPTPAAPSSTAPSQKVAPLSAVDRRAAEEARNASKNSVPERSGEEVRMGEPQLARGGTGPRSATGDARPSFESGAPARRFTQEEVQARGLLKERVIEVIEMREEAVISKEAFVHEEVIIRKIVSERAETVDETVRRTNVEVEELP